MKIKAIACAIVLLSLSAGAATTARARHQDPGNLFKAQELSLDLFASYTAAQQGIDEIFNTNIEHGDWGGGVGLNYFFTRELGIAADINMPDNGGNLVDSASGSLVFRLPWEAAGLAPYVFGGGGRLTEPSWQWSLHAGLGLEWRFSQHIGIFADGRYVWADDAYDDTYRHQSKFDGDHLLLRSGLRLVF